MIKTEKIRNYDVIKKGTKKQGQCNYQICTMQENDAG